MVEVAVDSVAGARAAAAAGAHRLELCGCLEAGGLTPSAGLFAAVRAAVALPVFAMLRPRPGDFVYDDDEFAVLGADLRRLRAAGADGFVGGALRPDGEVDVDRVAELVALARPLPVTFHRAFDLVAEPARALEALVAAGAARVLTSGQAPTAVAGADAIARHVAAAAGRLIVVAGAGVRPENVRALVDGTGVREVHLSATAFRPSPMRCRRDEVDVAPPPAPDRLARRTTDGAVVAAVLAALRFA
ncbi:MAG: copper homeostasis protein CutC [Planctomycetes bacterium]|nr:copper homeostasis protein CutC [Planctomycetota bacterium]